MEGVIRFGELKVKGFNMREIRDAEEIFSETSYPVIEGGVRVKFQPYETKVFLSDRNSSK